MVSPSSSSGQSKALHVDLSGREASWRMFMVIDAARMFL
jgi:hypothetical protein